MAVKRRKTLTRHATKSDTDRRLALRDLALNHVGRSADMRKHVMPLEVMIYCMDMALADMHEEQAKKKPNKATVDLYLASAMKAAEAAAPYLHPKLSSIHISQTPVDPDELSDSDLLRIVNGESVEILN
jgi:hypothetical protein